MRRIPQAESPLAFKEEIRFPFSPRTAKRILNAYIDWNGVAALGVFEKADRAFLYVAPWKRSGKRVVPIISKGIILAQAKLGIQG